MLAKADWFSATVGLINPFSLYFITLPGFTNVAVVGVCFVPRLCLFSSLAVGYWHARCCSRLPFEPPAHSCTFTLCVCLGAIISLLATGAAITCVASQEWFTRSGLGPNADARVTIGLIQLCVESSCKDSMYTLVFSLCVLVHCSPAACLPRET